MCTRTGAIGKLLELYAGHKGWRDSSMACNNETESISLGLQVKDPDNKS